MCGIVALFSAAGPVSRDALVRATQALHHRGPDGRGLWIAPHGGVGLGHTRLAIIDLSTGDQPIANEDDSIHAVVNGELYDFERIRRELQARGHRLRTRSDSEIVVHLYEELGEGCLEQLRGEFAFALWDDRRRVLFAARDRFGIKPLYYARVGDTLHLASEAKALFAAGVTARWDHETVYQDLVALSDASRTMFDGVYQVPPGHFLRATVDRIEVVPYWELAFPTAERPARTGSEIEHVERFRDALLEAIRLRLRADVPVGVYLSGGLDSCAVLGMASALGGGPLEAFTIAFDDPSSAYDESPQAEEMAERAGARCHVLHVSEDLLAAHFADAIAQSETIASNLHAPAKYLLSRKVRDAGLKAVLTGDGADELLGGYAWFRADAARDSGADEAGRRAQLTALQAANRHYGAFAAPAGAALSTESFERALGYVPTFVRSRAIAGKRAHALLSPAFADALGGRDPYQRFLDGLSPTATTNAMPVDSMHQSMRLWMKSYFPNKLLSYLGDRSEMAHSVEGRVPFLDHPLAELVASMPVAMKVRGTTEKYVLREAAEPFVTGAAYARPKHPFIAPLELRGRMRELIFDTLRPSRVARLPFFDPAAVARFLQHEPAAADVDERTGYFATLIILTSVCVLHERYGL
jgi:asparagine synthase (glutamine-hydrolysing)